MSDPFNIETKLTITGVNVKGDLNAGKLKFDVDTSALKQFVAEAGKAAQRAKQQFDNIKLNKIKVDLNKNSLRSVTSQIRQAIESAVKSVSIKPISVDINTKNIAAQIIQAAQSAKILSNSAGAGLPGPTMKPAEQKKLASNARALHKIDAATEKEAFALQKKIQAEREKGLKQMEAESQARTKRLQQIRNEVANEDKMRKGLHQKRLAEIEERTAKEIAALQKRINAERAALGKGGSSTTKGALPFPVGSQTTNISNLLGGGRGGGGGGRPPGGVPGGFGGGDEIRKTANAINDITSSTKRANSEMITLDDLTFQVGKKAAAFRGVAIAINTVVTSAQAAVKFVINFNDSLIELNKILQLSQKSLQIVGDDLFALSKQTGVAVDQTIQIAQEFARAGLAGRGYGTIVELTDRALMGLQGTTLDATQTSELFIQIIQQVESNVRGLNKELVTSAKLFDVLGKAEDITASKATDVQQAFKRSAASIFATGATIEEATAIISVLQERTQRGGDVIGTALKTLASRISSSTSDATKALNEIGVATIDNEGNLRNLFDVLQDTAVAFQSLTESERADIAVKAAGIRQVEIFRAALLDFGRTQDVTTSLIEASGDAARKQAAEQSKLTNVLARLQIGFQQLVKTASESAILGESFVFVVTKVEELVTAVADLDKRLGGAISTFAGVLGLGLGFRVLIPMLQGIGKAMMFFIGSQKESAVAMGAMKTGGDAVAATIESKINTSMQRTTMLTHEANTAMSMLGASTNSAALAAQRLQQGMLGPGSRGAQDQHGGSIIAPGVMRGQEPVSKMTKAAQGAGKAFQFVGKNIIAFGAIASVAGSALQGMTENLKDSGKGGLATAADIGGGALSGAGMGALIGSLVLPGIGTAIGGGVGAIAGAFEPLTRAFGNAKTEIDTLRDRYIKLGIVQAENGKITSAVSEKLDKALRNLESFQNFELKLEMERRKDLFDPDSAGARRTELEEARISAQKGLDATFDKTAKAVDRQSKIMTALSKALQARTGDTGLDLADSQFSMRSSPILDNIGETTLREIEAEAIQLAEEYGVAAAEVRDIFSEEINKIRSAPISKQAVDAARAAVEKSTRGFIGGLSNLIPAGEQISSEGGKLAEKFREAVSMTAKGLGGEEAEKTIQEVLGKVLSGQTVLKGEGGDSIVGSAGLTMLESLVDAAKDIASQRRNVAGQGLGQATPEILKRLGTILDPAVAAAQTQRNQDRLINSQQEVTRAFESLRMEAPFEEFGRLFDEPVNKLEMTLRGFIADFGREINKLDEAQIRASTAQANLADVMASNAADLARTTQRRTVLEKQDALRRSTEAIRAMPNAGDPQFESIDALRVKLGEGIIPRDAEDRILATGEAFDKVISSMSNVDLAELFEIDESDARKIKDTFAKTRGDAFTGLFEALFKANQQIADQRITDPDQQRDILTSARAGIDTSSLSEEQIQKVADNVLKLTKEIVNLDTEALQAIAKSNAAALDALKKRISEEEKQIAVDQRRREVLAMNARAMTEELTGIRRLVAEREIEASFTSETIGAQQNRISSLDAEIAKLNDIEKTELNRIGILDQLQTLEEKRTDESIKLEEMLVKSRIDGLRNLLQVANEAVSVSKTVADFESKRVGALSDINGLLAVNQSEMSKFNAELDNLGAQFKLSQAALAAEATVVNATIEDQGEREAKLNDIKQRGVALALDQAKAEAQVIKSRREAVKQVAEELLGNQSEQVDAQRAVMEATRAVGAAFEGYLQAVDGAIMATTRYNLGISLAAVETVKLTGGFTGMRDEISAVQDVFRDAENIARQLGASESTLLDIRRESINQQLSLFNSLLQEQSQMARSFFTSSSQDQAAMFQGIQEAANVADLLGGSFDDFRRLGESAINDLGAQLLALPQETRQRVISSLETLRGVGGSVGGFTADELLTAIETASLGVSGEGLQVDPLFEVQDRIATLQEEQARLATEQLLTSQEAVMSAQEQLEQAEASRDLAEIQLDRIKEEGEKLRGKLSDLQGQLNTTLLQQEQTQRQGFHSVTSAINRAADSTVNQLPNVFSVKVADALREVMRDGGLSSGDKEVPTSESRPTPSTRGSLAAEAMRDAGRNKAVAQQQFAQAGPSVMNQVQAASLAQSSAGSADPNNVGGQTIRRLEDIISGIRELNTTGTNTLAVAETIRDASGNALGTATATAGAAAAPEITINVEGQTTVTVTGFEAGVARLATTLAESLGGFVSAEEARRIANEVLENIRKALLQRGIITPTTL